MEDTFSLLRDRSQRWGYDGRSAGSRESDGFGGSEVAECQQDGEKGRPEDVNLRVKLRRQGRSGYCLDDPAVVPGFVCNSCSD